MMSSKEDERPRESGPNIRMQVYGVQGGSVVHSTVAGCTFGSNVTVNEIVCIKTPNNDCDKESLQARTLYEISNKTRHCVTTRSLTKVLRKCQGQQKCVTITGAPGDGKTTLAYMTLRELQQNCDHDVFAIKSVKEYYTITSVKSPKDTYIMINDVFGMCVFQKDSYDKWRPVLEDVMFDKSLWHIKLLLVSRINVLQEAKAYLHKFEAQVSAEDCLFDLNSPSHKLSFDEKVQIFDVYNTQQLVDEDTRDTVCKLSSLHGFPNCCSMFFSINQKSCDPTRFFKSPIGALKGSTRVLIAENDSYKKLFMEIIQMDGVLDLNTIRQTKTLLTDEERKRAVNNLKGSFIEEEYESVVFKHPSIFETVSFVIGTIDPLFVIERCSMAFWIHHVRLKPACGTNVVDSQQHLIQIGREYISEITQRVAKELMRGNLGKTLRHDVFNDNDFVERIFQFIKDRHNWKELLFSHHGKDLPSHLEENRPATSLQRARLGGGSETLIDKRSFLFLCTSSTSKHLLSLIHKAFPLPKFAVENLLFGACQNNATSCVSFIFTTFPNVNVNLVDAEGDTPFIVSSVKGNIIILDLLMKHGANPNVVNRRNLTPLHYLCAAGHLKGVEMIITKIQDINKVGGHNENTALHEAAKHRSDRSLACVQMLIEGNAEINLKNSIGATPMHEAAKAANGETVKYLLEAGAYPHSEDNTKTSPLMSACHSGSFDIVEVLLNKKADIDKQDVHGYTALHLASKSGYKDIVFILLQRGANMNILNKDQKTAFHVACENGHGDIVQIFIEFGVDIHHRNYNTSPFHLACYNGHVDVVRTLIDAGVDIEDKDRGKTPLVIACEGRRLSLLEFLADRNANMKVLDSDLNTLLHRVALHAHGGHRDVAEILLNHGMDVNVRNRHDKTPLHLACESGHVDLARLFISRKATVQCDRNNETPLHEACYPVHNTIVPKRKQDITLILIQTGTCVNTQDKNGQTPLHYACKSGYHFAEIPDSQKFLRVFHNAQLHKVMYLLQHDANINMQDNSGRTPLHIACDPPELAFFLGDHAEYKERYYTLRAELVNALIKSGADANIFDKNNIPALHGHFERNLGGMYSQHA
ncbi:uncharacterized protein [Haliotis asinina]|uniref:uncharacterized protein isoform X1 n=1 Tax=Haliotis asinina TaxID=109174 RepID=UPI0035324609